MSWSGAGTLKEFFRDVYFGLGFFVNLGGLFVISAEAYDYWEGALRGNKAKKKNFFLLSRRSIFSEKGSRNTCPSWWSWGPWHMCCELDVFISSEAFQKLHVMSQLQFFPSFPSLNLFFFFPWIDFEVSSRRLFQWLHSKSVPEQLMKSVEWNGACSRHWL